jgi:hypothetical protein
MAAYVHTALANSGDDDSENPMEKMREMFGPGHVDQTVRGAIQACWMALPKDRRNADELERQVRRMVERALKDFREDSEQFGR